MQYSSTFVQYERRGGTLVPVRVTKQWVSREDRRGQVSRAFQVTRITEVPWRQLTDRERAPEPWVSSSRVEGRDRLLILSERGVKDGEPLVREAGYDQYWLPYSVPANPTAAQAAWSLDNGNGWLPPRVQPWGRS